MSEVNQSTQNGSLPEPAPLDVMAVLGWVLQSDPLQHFQNVKDMEVRDDDVFICAFAKSGTHWVWEMVSMLHRREATHDAHAKEMMMLDFTLVPKLADVASPRIINTHFNFQSLPKQMFEKKTKIIHIRRNPKDLAVSLFNHRKGSVGPLFFEGDFNEFLQDFLYKHGAVNGRSWFTYEKDWESLLKSNPDLNCLSLTYEDVKEDPVGNVQKLAEFLQLEASNQLCEEIAQACNFDRMKQADKQKKFPEHVAGVALTHEFLAQSGLYRKGEVGDWKNWFTVAQSEEFDRVYEEQMKDSNLTFKFSLK